MAIHKSIFNRDIKGCLVEMIQERVSLHQTVILHIDTLNMKIKKSERCTEKHELFLLTDKYLFCLYSEPVYVGQSVDIIIKAKIHLRWAIGCFYIRECNGDLKYCIEFIKNNKKVVFEAIDNEKYEKWVRVLRKHTIQQNFHDRYKASSLIATQRYGLLFKSVELSTNDIYFVEKIEKDKFEDDEIAESIIYKIKTLKKLRGYPGVIQLHEMYESKKSVYIVYESYFGGPVFNFALKYDMKTFVKILRDIFGVLKLLESYGITHGYLRPKNIYFKYSNSRDERNEIIINDFSYLTITKGSPTIAVKSDKSITKVMGRSEQAKNSNLDLTDLAFIAINYLYYRQFNRPIEKLNEYTSVILDESLQLPTTRKLIS